MKKKLLVMSLALALVLSVTIVGCGEVTPLPPELTLIFSTHNPDTNAMAQAQKTYAEYIKNHSDGKIDYEFYPGESLLGQQAAFEGVQARTADVAQYVPEIGDGIEYIQVMVMPFMGFPSREKATEIYWTLVEDYPEILGQFPSTTKLATYYLMPGYQLHYYAANLVVDEPEDLAGLTINAMEGTWVSLLDTLGAAGSFLTFPEVMSGIPSGIGDGFLQHNEFCAFFNLLQFFRSHTFFEGGISFMPIGELWNKEAWDETVAIVGEEVLEAAHQEWLTKAYQGTATDTVLVNEFFTAHAAEQTQTYLTGAQTEANGWVVAAAPYITTWQNLCDDPDLAADIYDAAQALIAAS